MTHTEKFWNVLAQVCALVYSKDIKREETQ